MVVVVVGVVGVVVGMVGVVLCDKVGMCRVGLLHGCWVLLDHAEGEGAWVRDGSRGVGAEGHRHSRYVYLPKLLNSHGSSSRYRKRRGVVARGRV